MKKARKVMADKELKPCPFCGSKAEFIVYVGKENRKDTHKVACMADNSDHHGKEGVSEDWCPMEMQTDWCLTKEDAAGIWNHRQPDKEQFHQNKCNSCGDPMSNDCPTCQRAWES